MKQDEKTNALEENKMLRRIFENSSDSIYVTDGQGVTIYVNKAFEKMARLPISVVLGKNVYALEEEGIFKPSISALVLREKRPLTIIQNMQCGKQTVVTGTPVFNEAGEIDMVVCNSQDIDEMLILKKYLLKPSQPQTSAGHQEGSGFLYTSGYMENLLTMADKVAGKDSTVLITGESGTGKGVLAKYIHENSPRANEKMIEINCSAIPESLFESELFGYESGAFTGAQKGGKAGIIEMADKGTLFLDELGDLPVHMQAKLLKVLQDKQVFRVGSLHPLKIDVRIIAATNKDIKMLIEKELFRSDLFYRLNVFPIHIAPLRERKEDLLALIQHFVLHFNKTLNANITLTPCAIEHLAGYPWPGNIRELEHFIERLAIIKDGTIDQEDLDIDIWPAAKKSAVQVNELIPLQSALQQVEKQLIQKAVQISSNSYKVGELLGISQASAHRKMKKYT